MDLDGRQHYRRDIQLLRSFGHAKNPGNVPGSRSLAAKLDLIMQAISGCSVGKAPIQLGVGGYLNDLWEFNPSTSEWACISGSIALPSVSHCCARSIRNAGNSSSGECAGRPRRSDDVDRRQRQPVALWWRRRRLGWRFRLFERPVAVQHYNQRVDLDGWPKYTEPAGSVWNVGNACSGQHAGTARRCSYLGRQVG